MDPRTRITLPAEVQERIDGFRKLERAANHAAASLMRTGVVDASGKETTLFELASSIGNADAIRNAARDVFTSLTMAGMSYQEFRDRHDVANSAIPEDVRHAVRHFYYVMTDSYDLQSIGLGRGDLLLIAMDWHIARYLKTNAASTGTASRLAS